MFEVGREYQVVVGSGEQERYFTGRILQVHDHLVKIGVADQEYIFSTRSGFQFAQVR